MDTPATLVTDTRFKLHGGDAEDSSYLWCAFCHWVSGHRCFEWSSYFHLQVQELQGQNDWLPHTDGDTTTKGETSQMWRHESAGSWDMMLSCSNCENCLSWWMVNRYLSYEKTFCLHLQGRKWRHRKRVSKRTAILYVYQTAILYVYQTAILYADQTAVLYAYQTAVLYVYQTAALYAYQTAVLYASQTAVLYAYQTAVLYVYQTVNILPSVNATFSHCSGKKKKKLLSR